MEVSYFIKIIAKYIDTAILSKRILSPEKLNLVIPELIPNHPHEIKCVCAFCLKITRHRICREVYINLKCKRIELYEDEDANETLNVVSILQILQNPKYYQYHIFAPSCCLINSVRPIKSACLSFSPIYQIDQIKIDV